MYVNTLKALKILAIKNFAEFCVTVYSKHKWCKPRIRITIHSIKRTLINQLEKHK